MPNQSVIEVAHRKLKRLENYTSLIGRSEGIPSFLDNVPLVSSETLIGFYTNNPSNPHQNIVVTDMGLYFLLGSEWRWLPYAEITRISSPEDKTHAAELAITVQGREFVLPIRGGTGRFRDVFAFMTFLRDVAKNAVIIPENL